MSSMSQRTRGNGAELKLALTACRGAFIGVGAMSGLVILLAVLYAFQGVSEIVRGRVLVRIGAVLDERLSPRAFDAVMRSPLKFRVASDGIQALRDLDNIRAFASGGGPMALFDLPWLPLYLVICFLFHPLIGAAALLGAIMLIAMTIMSEFLTWIPS